MEGDSEAVNLELWSGMLLLSEHASSSSYERPLKEDGMLTITLCTSHLSLVSRYQIVCWQHSLQFFGFVPIHFNLPSEKSFLSNIYPT